MSYPLADALEAASGCIALALTDGEQSMKIAPLPDARNVWKIMSWWLEKRTVLLMSRQNANALIGGMFPAISVGCSCCLRE